MQICIYAYMYKVAYMHKVVYMHICINLHICIFEEPSMFEDVLSQAMDHSVLEQLAAINCSSFSTTDNLPSHLETRFRKLKSLPTTTTTSAGSRFPPSKSRSLRPRSGDDLNLNERPPEFCGSVDFERIPDRKKDLESPEENSDGNRDERKGFESESKSKTNLNLNTNPNDEVRKQRDFKRKSGTGSSKSRSSGMIFVDSVALMKVNQVAVLPKSLR